MQLMGEVDMKDYGALRIIAKVLIFCGWTIIVVGALSCLLALGLNLGMSRYSTTYASPFEVVLFTVVIGVAFLVCGILVLATGEIILAIVDIATNSASLPLIASSASSIASNTSKTLGFFEKMEERANHRSQAVAS
jgi:hypothetical protein